MSYYDIWDLRWLDLQRFPVSGTNEIPISILCRDKLVCVRTLRTLADRSNIPGETTTERGSRGHQYQGM
jgi:hypothetical protein